MNWLFLCKENPDIFVASLDFLISLHMYINTCALMTESQLYSIKLLNCWMHDMLHAIVNIKLHFMILESQKDIFFLLWSSVVMIYNIYNMYFMFTSWIVNVPLLFLFIIVVCVPIDIFVMYWGHRGKLSYISNSSPYTGIHIFINNMLQKLKINLQ